MLLLQLLVLLLLPCAVTGDVRAAWAQFRHAKYTEFVTVKGVTEDGEEIDVIEDTINTLSNSSQRIRSLKLFRFHGLET